MKIELRGTLRAALGTGTLEVDVPPEGLPLNTVLDRLTDMNPRAKGVFSAMSGGYTLRVVVNGTVVDRGTNPWLGEGDTLLLLTAMQGG